MPAREGSPAGISGTVLRANRAALATLVGERLLREVFGRDPRFAFWNEATGLGWHDASAIEESLRALAAAAGRDAEELNAEATRIGAAQSFRTVWRVLLRFTSDDALVSRVDVMYRRAFNTGRMIYEPEGEGRSTLRLLDWPDAPRIHMLGLAAGIEVMLHLAARPLARASYHPAGVEHHFRVDARG